MDQNGYGGIFDDGGLPLGFGEPAPTVPLKEERVEHTNPRPSPPRQMNNPSIESKFPAAEVEGPAAGDEGYGRTKEERKAFWQNLGQNLTSAFTDSTGSAEATGPCTRSGKDAYVYLQYPDGSIKIDSGPANPGKEYAAGTAAANAVEAMYGKCTTGTAVLTAVGSSGSSASSSSTGGRGAEIGAGVGAFTAQLLPTLAALLGPTQVTPLDEEYEDLSATSTGTSTFPWLIVGGGVAVVGLLGATIYLLSRDKDEPLKQVVG